MSGHAASLGETDLNLLKPLHALLEELHVTKAAVRCGLSQPAMSRALERLRTSLNDELLVKSGGRFERTARAEELLVELRQLLPRLETALNGARFDPSSSRQTFRIACTEYAATIVLPALVAELRGRAPRVTIEASSWNTAGLAKVESGLVDLALVDSSECRALESEGLFQDDFACVVARAHPLADEQRVGLKRYLEYPHIEIAVSNGRTPLIDISLAAHGARRRVGYRTQFPLSGLLVAAASEAIYTTPRRFAHLLARSADVRILDAPCELPRFTYAMAWHARQNEDAVHGWLRHQLRRVRARL